MKTERDREYDKEKSIWEGEQVARPKVQPFGIANRIMNNIIWGKSHFNPNEVDIAPDDEAMKKSVPPLSDKPY